MLKFCSLYSGSSGNSFFVQSDNSKILVDAGVSCKKIVDALASINVDILSIDAVLVTHEHTDHTQSIGTISKKYNIPVYANRKTWLAMPAQMKKISENNIFYFSNNEDFKIKDLKIFPFNIPHDAANPCGFNISKDQDNQISIATDIGHMTKSIVNTLEGSKFILLESNYDTEVLRCCGYPYSLKSRIASNTGHLSNTMAGKTISYLLKNGNLATAMLGHLSKESNFPELAYQTVIDEIISNNNTNINLSVASRDCPGKLITI